MSSKQEVTKWNGIPTPAVRGSIIVKDDHAFPMYWARKEGIIGQRIDVVCVVLEGANYGGGVIYLDDRQGQGWRKVTGGGGPAYGHAGVEPVAGSWQPRTTP